MSPHASAAIDGIEINLDKFAVPKTKNHLIIEGAGGLLVPLNNKDNIIDLIEHLQIPTILVSKNYLGSINHTLLSFEALKRRTIPIAGIVFNGKKNKTTEEIIESRTGLEVLFRLEELPEISAQTIQAKALAVQQDIFEKLKI